MTEITAADVRSSVGAVDAGGQGGAPVRPARRPERAERFVRVAGQRPEWFSQAACRGRVTEWFDDSHASDAVKVCVQECTVLEVCFEGTSRDVV